VGLHPGERLLVAAHVRQRREAGRERADADDQLAAAEHRLGQLGADGGHFGDLAGGLLRRAVGERADGHGPGRRTGVGGGRGAAAAGGCETRRERGRGGAGHEGAKKLGAEAVSGHCWALSGTGGAMSGREKGVQSTLLRNSRVRGCLGRSSTSAGGPCSTIRPPSRKTTRSATSRAKPISW